MYCSNCGKSIPSDSNICPYCGNKINNYQEGKPKEKIYYVSAKSRTLAGILCLLGFGGLAGIHRMYVGRWKTGLLYAVTFGVFFLGTLYDIYQIYYESFKDTDGYPLYADSSMKSNHKKRTPRGDANIFVKVVAVLFLFSAFGNISMLLTSHHPSQQAQTPAKSEDKADDKGNDKKSEHKSKQNKEDELELVEKVKENYQHNNFLEASSALSRLKNFYPDSQYIAALQKDYPDLSIKTEQIRAEKDREYKEALDAFNSEMSVGPGSDMYEGYEIKQGGIKFCVYVNSYWHSLTEGQKKTYTEIAYTTFKKYGLNAPKFYIVNVNNNRNLAHYPGIMGGAAIDD